MSLAQTLAPDISKVQLYPTLLASPCSQFSASAFGKGRDPHSPLRRQALHTMRGFDISSLSLAA